VTLPDRTRIVITGGPTPEEAAAVVAAVDRLLQDEHRPSPPRPAWQEAARRESVGFGTVRSRWDLARPTG